jgi:hypothetical protein
MDSYRGPHTALNIALHRGLYLDRYGGPHTALTIALHRGLYLSIITVRYRGPKTSPYYSLAWRPLLSHYNGPL